MKKMILVTNDAQSCGKTSIALVLSEYLRRKQLKTCLLNTSVEQELPCATELLNLEEEPQASDLIRLLGKHDAVVCDIQTEHGAAFGAFLQKHGIEEVLLELNVDLTVILPICEDSVVHREAMARAEAFTGMAEFIAIQSPLMADVPESYESSRLAKALRLLGASIVVAPSLADEVLDQIDEMSLTLPLALTQRSLLPRFLTHELLAWEVEYAARLDAVAEDIVPRHEKVDDLGIESVYGELLTA